MDNYHGQDVEGGESHLVTFSEEMPMHDGTVPNEDSLLKDGRQSRGGAVAQKRRRSTMKRSVAVSSPPEDEEEGNNYSGLTPSSTTPPRRASSCHGQETESEQQKEQQQQQKQPQQHRYEQQQDEQQQQQKQQQEKPPHNKLQHEERQQHLKQQQQQQQDRVSLSAICTQDSSSADGEQRPLELEEDADLAEGDALLSSKESNGRLKQPVQRRTTRTRWPQRMSSASLEKRDLMVSRDSTTDSGTRTRAYSRHTSEMSSACCRNDASSDECRQCLDLCQAFFKPCCPCCRRCEPAESPSYTPTKQRGILKYEESIIIPEDPFRKRCIHACMTFVYVMLVLVGVVVTYSMLADLVESMKNPVRSIHYHKVTDYDAPGIAVYPGGAEFLACGHYYNNVVTSKVRLTQLDLVNQNCSFTRMRYRDPHYPDIERDAIVIRGPTSFSNREAIFLHFALEDQTRDFFTVSYFVFPNFDQFNASQDRVSKMLDFHKYMPTFALSAGLRMWIKLIMSETYLMDDSKHTEFNVEYSVVRFVDRRPENETHRHLFFIFFEWKNDIIEQSRLLYSTTPWSIGAGLCGVFLTLHRVYQLAQTSYKRMRKDQQRRSIRKRTLRELRQRSMESGTLR